MDLKEFNEVLNSYIRPQTFPLAMRMCKSAAEIPEKVRLPVRDLHTPITICQGIGMARKYGWTLAIGKEDQVCPWGALAMGFVPPKKEWLDGSIADTIGYRDTEVMAGIAAELPRFDYDSYSYLLMAPIHAAIFEPHVITIYGNSAQVMTLVQARLHASGGTLTSSSSGMADCADILVRTMLSGECQFILPCGGDRVFGMSQNDEMIFTLPPAQMEIIAQGLKGGLSVGVQRYPIPVFLRFQPQMPPAYQKLMEFLSSKE